MNTTTAPTSCPQCGGQRISEAENIVERRTLPLRLRMTVALVLFAVGVGMIFVAWFCVVPFVMLGALALSPIGTTSFVVAHRYTCDVCNTHWEVPLSKPRVNASYSTLTSRGD